MNIQIQRVHMRHLRNSNIQSSNAEMHAYPNSFSFTPNVQIPNTFAMENELNIYHHHHLTMIIQCNGTYFYSVLVDSTEYIMHSLLHKVPTKITYSKY